ncbi:MAG: hypothetical protein HKL90_01070 [Elusimicrobia bacterium]|nr:hypothetical protein [Elusimicrobiota bacterium]
MKYDRDSPGYAQFRPYLALEPAENSPILIEGILQTWRQLDEGAPGAWYERSLPAAFRREFLWIPGLESYAVASADEIAEPLRSPAWTRLLDWKRRYKTLDPRRKVALLRLLGMLGFYRDNDELLRGDAPASARGTLEERLSEHAYLKANNRVLLDEPGMKGDYSEMFDVARRAKPGSEIRLLAAVKTMTLYAEHGQDHENLHAAQSIARKTLERLRARISPSAFFAMSSRYWRTVSYIPFLRGDYDEVERRLDLAEEFVRRAISAGTPSEAAFARDILYAVLATRSTSDVRTGRPERARPRLAEMIAMDPLGAWQRLWLGTVAYETGELEEARFNYLLCLRLAPPGVNKACGLLSRCLKRLGRAEEAARWAARAELTKPAPLERAGREAARGNG